MSAGMLLALMPVAYAPDDTTTTFRVGGHYAGGTIGLVSRGCEGEVLSVDETTFREGGVDAEVSIPITGLAARARAAAHVAFVSVGDVEARLINPVAGLDWRWVGVGAGVFASTRALPRLGDRDGADAASHADESEVVPSLHLRLGPVDELYANLQLLHASPAFGTGYGQLGLGHSSPAWRAWAGVSFLGPQDGSGTLLRADIRLREGLYVGSGLRLGRSVGVDEHAVLVSFSYEPRAR